MDIVSLPVEYDKGKIDGKYRLVAIATQRAKELSVGGKPKIVTKAKKVTTIAIEEAVDGRLEFLTGEDARMASEKAGKFDFRRRIEESRKIATREDLTELEKDLKVYLHEKETMEKRAFEELFSSPKEEEADETDEAEE